MGLFVFLKSQLDLFGERVPVKGYTRKDGTRVDPHYTWVRKRRKAQKPKDGAKPAERTKQGKSRVLSDKERAARSREEAPTPKRKTKREVMAEASLDLFDDLAEPPADMPAPALKSAAQLDGDAAFVETPSGEIEFDVPPFTRRESAEGPDYSLPFGQIPQPDMGAPLEASKAERRKLNEKAREVLARHEGRGHATGAEREILRRYSGTGGIGDSLNEYFTRPDVATAMWKTLDRLGVASGEVLEPSCGTGVFLESSPGAVSVTGVELDTTNARIAAELAAPRHAVHNTSLERFASLSRRQFDAVVGNCPFGLRGALIKDDKPDLKSAEQYFLDTAIDKCKPGGVVAMIVPASVVDNQNGRSFRERLLKKAKFLGAQRLPNTAFGHTHTGVTADIVYFRARNGEDAGALRAAPRWLLDKAGAVLDDEFIDGAYFRGRGKDNIFGTPEKGWRAKAGMGSDWTVSGSMEGVADAASHFEADAIGVMPSLDALLDAAGDDDALKARLRTAAQTVAYRGGRAGETKQVDGVWYILQGDPLRWHRMDEADRDVPESVHAAQPVARAIQELLETPHPSDEQRNAVVGALDAYVDRYGAPRRNRDLRREAERDPVLWRLISAVRDDGSYSDRVAGRERSVEDSSIEEVVRRLAVAQQQFTAQEVADDWAGGDAEQAADYMYASHEFALAPDGEHWLRMEDYLAGDLWSRLDALEEPLSDDDADAGDRRKWERQHAALLELIDPQSLEDVDLGLDSGFVPLEVRAAFFNAKVRKWNEERPGISTSEMTITYEDGFYSVEGGPLGDDKLMSTLLNRTGLRRDDLPRVERLNSEFKDWLCASEYRDQVEDKYNRTFRGYVARLYSESPLEVPGLNPDIDDINPYHWSGLRWAMDAGKGIIADDVGLGKTPRGLMLARLAVASGRAKKPAFVVPKSVMANWVAEAEKWFPGASIMTIGETIERDKDGEIKSKNDSKAVRDKKLNDLAQNDYDFVFISMPAWNDIDVTPAHKHEYATSEFWAKRGEALGNAGDKRIKKIREAYEQSLANRDFDKRTNATYFEDLGIDMLVLDEAHSFKNLFAARSRFGESPKFLGGSGQSNRALDTQYKTRFVREQNDGSNVYMLTATPTKNSPLEIYSMLSHIAPEDFERRGIMNSEDFIDRFCQFSDQMILGTDGSLTSAQCVTGFKNLGELRELMSAYINRRTADDVGLKLPAREDKTHFVDMTDRQHAVYEQLREEIADDADEQSGSGHIFSIMDRMGKATIDLGLLDEADAGAPSPKIDACVEEAFRGASDGGQLIFADHNGIHERIKKALVDRGVPADQIAIMNASTANTGGKRQTISDRFNAGKLKYVIGNTGVMGEGVNLQKRTADIHHLELPWEPATMQQRNGRGVRQGNKLSGVRVHTYLAKGSFDGYRHQTIAAKKDWQDLLWHGGDTVENLAAQGQFSRDELMIMLSADPEAARRAYEEDKAAAAQRARAAGRQRAAEQFVKLQQMRSSLRKLKDHATPAAQRLQARVDRLRERLHADHYFTAKHVLDMDHHVYVEPQTGAAYYPGAAFTLEGGAEGPIYYSDTPSHWVVTGFDRRGSIEARPWGKLSESRQTFPPKRMNKGVALFDYDAGAEERARTEALHVRDKAQAIGATSPAALRDASPQFVKDNYKVIQDGLREAAHGFTGRWDGAYGLIDKDGRAFAVQSHEKRQHIDSNDSILPIPEHRELAKQAYARMELAKRWETDYSAPMGRHARRRDYPVRMVYPGFKFGREQANPWASIGNKLWGHEFVAEAHRYATAAVETAIEREPDLYKQMMLASSVAERHGGAFRYPRKVVERLVASAQAKGALDKQFRDLRPEELKAVETPGALFPNRGGSVRSVLRGILHQSGYRDLLEQIPYKNPESEAA